MAYGRLGPLGAWGTAALLGVFGFVAAYLTPFIKYPPNPPSVGDPETIGRRTALYLVLVLLSIAAMVLAVRARQGLVPGWADGTPRCSPAQATSS
jgi:Probable cobalt transporter subunit (CbtA)